VASTGSSGESGAWRASVAWIAGILALLFLFYFEMIVKGYEPFAPDSAASLILRAWLDRHDGRPPLWNSEISLGMPTFGSYTYTPVGVLTWLAQTFDLNRGTSYVLALGLGGAAFFTLLRRFNASAPASFAGAVSLVFTPYVIGLVNAAHSTKLVALALVPVVFWALDGIARGRGWLWVGITAWALAQLVWANHPQIAFYAALVLGPYFLVRAWKEGWWRDRVRVGQLAFALALTLLMIAHPILDVLHYTQESTRGAPSVLPGPAAMGTTSWDYATAWSFPPQELISFVFPSFFGLQGQTYWGFLPFTQSTHAIGIVVLCYALIGFGLLRGWVRVFWLGAALVVLVIGFGRNLPILYGPLFHFLPFFDKFRVPSMIYSVLPLIAAFPMAVALDAVASGGEDGGSGQGARRAAIFFRVIAVLFGIVLFLGILGRVAGGGSSWFQTAWERGGGGAPAELIAERRHLFWTDIVRASAIALLAALVALARLRAKLTPAAYWVATLFLLSTDLYLIDRPFYAPAPPRTTANARLLPEDLVTTVTSTSPRTRVLPLSLESRGGKTGLAIAADTDWPLVGVESVGGYHPAGLRRVKDFVQSGAWQNPGTWRSLDVGFVSLAVPGVRLDEEQRIQLATSFPMLERVGQGQTPTGDVLLFRYPANLGRAYVVPESRAIPDPLERLEFLGSPEFDPTSLVVLEDEVPSPAAREAWSASAAITTHAEERVAVAVSGSGGFLVLADAYYPDWRATLDGAPATIYPANHVVRALAVPPGEHEIVFTFRDVAYERGRWIGRAGRWAATFVALLGLAWTLRSRRRG
jgi:hypothetical protein